MIQTLIIIGVVIGSIVTAIFAIVLFLSGKDDAKNIDVEDYEIFENNFWKKNK